MTQDNEWTDWIEHDGGECPVPEDELILVRSDTGWEPRMPIEAKCFFWKLTDSIFYVSHYKRKKSAVEVKSIRYLLDCHEDSTSIPVYSINEEYIHKDIHDKRVTELLESSNQSLERARKAEEELKFYKLLFDEITIKELMKAIRD